MFGWLLLFLLTAWAFLGSIALALRTRPDGRAELGIATALAFSVVIAAPIYVLGFTNALWPRTLAPLSLLCSGVALSVAPGASWREKIATSCRAARRLASIPVDAFASSFVARSPVLIGLAGATALLLLAFVFTCLIDFAGWDEFMYHIPIVGFSIQNHGFRVVELPLTETNQGINGYPRLCEVHSLWFVIFTDRRLIELPAVLYAGPLMLGVYALARRYVDSIAAVGVAVVLFLVPHIWHQVCTTYNDLETGFFLVSALYYASRPCLRIVDAAVAFLAMALVAASKITWLVFVPPIALVAYGRVLHAHFRERRGAALALVAGSVLGMALVAGLSLGRNWVNFRDPFWPFGFDAPALGIHWGSQMRPYSSIQNPDPPLAEQYTPPEGGMADIIHRGYGMAFMWIGLPLGLLAVLVWVATCVWTLVRREPVPWNFGALILPALVGLKTSPTWGQPRYNIHIIAALFVAGGAWLLRGTRWTRMREGVLGAQLALSLIPFYWLKNANPASYEAEEAALRHPFALPPRNNRDGFDWLERDKEEELMSGDRVFWSQLAFVGALWNSKFSNTVTWIPFDSEAQFLARIADGHPKWVCAGASSAAAHALGRAGWSAVGRTNPGLDEVCYRRKM